MFPARCGMVENGGRTGPVSILQQRFQKETNVYALFTFTFPIFRFLCVFAFFTIVAEWKPQKRFCSSPKKGKIISLLFSFVRKFDAFFVVFACSLLLFSISTTKSSSLLLQVSIIPFSKNPVQQRGEVIFRLWQTWKLSHISVLYAWNGIQIFKVCQIE